MSRTAFCSAHPAAMLPARNSPMPETSRSLAGSASITSKVFSPNARDNPFGELWADAPDHAGAEVFLDALGGRRRRRLEKVRLELQPVGPVRDPDADRVDEFARRDRRRVADDRDKIALAPRLHFEDDESAVLIVERHPLDRADERCLGLRCVVMRLQGKRPE